MSALCPPEAVVLILQSEGLNQPGKWPGGASGITLGYGYDLAHHDEKELRRDWSQHLRDDYLKRLASVCGLAGDLAQRAAISVRDIAVTTEQADEVFRRASLPKYQRLTAEAFSGVEALPEKAQGALVSLVFNRGAGMDGDRRAEMRVVRELVAGYGADAHAALEAIAEQVEQMARLWGEGAPKEQRLPGLVIRRKAEAALIRGALAA